MIDLGTLAGFADGQAAAINSAGQIVGTLENPTTGAQCPFIYTGGKMVDLNSLIDPTLHYTLQGAGAINDSGQIVADGMDAGGGYLSVVLTPVPEPSMLLLLGVAALSVLAWKRVGCRNRRH
jgi:probable HAF family extracellular repeat protein